MRLAGVSSRQRMKNKDFGLDLNQVDTLVVQKSTEMQIAVVRACEMDG